MIFQIDNHAIIKFLENRSSLEDSPLPFLHLKSLNKNYKSLIFFVNQNNSNINIWQVSNDKSYNLICDISLSNFAFILPVLVNFDIKEIKQSIISNIKKTSKWYQEAVNKIIDSLQPYSGLKEFSLLYINKEFFGKLTNLLFKTYIYNPKIFCSKSLIDFVNKNTTPSDTQQIKILFETINSRLGEDYNCEFSNLYKYFILRELVCLVTGKHVVLDPFTFDYVFSDCTVLCTIGNYYSRLIKYKSSSGSYFIERRGPGWMDITSSIIFQNGLIIDIRTGPQHDAHRPDQSVITIEEEEFVKNLFENNVPLSEEKENQYLLINVDYCNLGHVLWNEVSGYVELILSFRDAQLTPKKIIPLLPPSIPSYFSKSGVRSHFFPYIKKTLYNQSNEQTEKNIIIDYMDSISEEPISNKFFIKNQPISFRFPQMSKLVANTIANEFPNIKKTKIHIYKNIRFHNKSQTNLIECLSEFFKKLVEEEDFRLKPENIEIDLEFSSDTIKGPSFQARDHVNNILNKIRSLCDKYNVKLNLHDSYDIPELMKLISVSDICIVPIGSGAVLPTWIFNKPTVFHSNQNHYSQLEWWNKVGNIKNDNQFIVPQNTSHDVTETKGFLYSNYTVEPEAYAITVVNALKSYILNSPYTD